MARERMITRTINQTNATAMLVNVRTATVESAIFAVTGEVYVDKAELLKAVKAQYETDEVKVVDITHWDTEQILYGMPEIDFIKMAKILPPRGKEGD